MPTWPVTLPPPAINTFEESPPDADLKSPTDKGPAKVRRRSTANIRPISFNLNLTAAQVQDLDDFYLECGGYTRFDFEHPRTGAPVTARFMEKPAYKEREGVLYNVSVGLEILP